MIRFKKHWDMHSQYIIPKQFYQVAALTKTAFARLKRDRFPEAGVVALVFKQRDEVLIALDSELMLSVLCR